LTPKSAEDNARKVYTAFSKTKNDLTPNRELSQGGEGEEDISQTRRNSMDSKDET